MAGDPRWLKLHFQEQCPNQGTELAGWENNSHRCGCCYCCFTGHHREPWWSLSHPNSDTLFFWVGTATSAPQKANTSVATHPTKIIEDSTSKSLPKLFLSEQMFHMGVSDQCCVSHILASQVQERLGVSIFWVLLCFWWDKMQKASNTPNIQGFQKV